MGMAHYLETAGEILWEHMEEPLWERILSWLNETVFSLAGEIYTSIGSVGSEVFERPAVRAFLALFRYFGFALFALALGMSAFRTVMAMRHGEVPVRETLVSALYGFLASFLVTELPAAVYRATLELQSLFASEIARVASSGSAADPSERFTELNAVFSSGFGLVMGIAMVYCMLHIFFSSVKRSGVILIQMAVGSLYIFSLTGGDTAGFVRWMRQVAAVCLTSFVQMALFLLGTVTIGASPLVGLGLLLSAKDVPRFADRFGLDVSVRGSLRGVASGTVNAVKILQGRV